MFSWEYMMRRRQQLKACESFLYMALGIVSKDHKLGWQLQLKKIYFFLDLWHKFLFENNSFLVKIRKRTGWGKMIVALEVFLR